MPSTQQKIKKKQEIPIDGASIYIFDRKGSCRIQNMVGMGWDGWLPRSGKVAVKGEALADKTSYIFQEIKTFW